MGGGARVSEIFFTKNPNQKKVFFCVFFWGGERGWEWLGRGGLE